MIPFGLLAEAEEVEGADGSDQDRGGQPGEEKRQGGDCGDGDAACGGEPQAEDCGGDQGGGDTEGQVRPPSPCGDRA